MRTIIRLGDRILVRRQLVRIGEIKDIFHIRAAAVHNVFGKIQILLLPGQAVKPDNRLQQGGRIQSPQCLVAAVIGILSGPSPIFP